MGGAAYLLRSAHTMQRLLPDPGPVDPAQLIPELRLGDRAPVQRPYVIANFVSSADGRATVKGGSTALGDEGDLAIFRTLRGCADAVLAGTGTLEAEHYGVLSRAPVVVALRDRLGLRAQPPLVTITRTGAVPRIPLLDDPGSTLLVYSGAAVDLGDTAATIEVIRLEPEQLTMAGVLADLRARHDVRLLLCEGGPTVFGRLVSEAVADELFLTLAATIAGGDGIAVTEHLHLDQPAEMSLRWALEQDGSLYLRYGLHL
jgi:riboflavin biosynthesis pyrimidine reductase